MRAVSGPTDRVVIVGAGLGGLACALHLAAAGREVTVLERESVPGGRAGRLTVGGYEFDTGPTVLTMPELIDETLAAVGERLTDWLTLIRLDPAYRAHFPDGSTLDVLPEPEADGRRDRPGLRHPRGRRDTAGSSTFADGCGGWSATTSSIATSTGRSTWSVRPWPGWPWPVASAGSAAGSATSSRDPRTRRIFSFQSLYAGLAPHRRAGAVRRHRLPGHRRRRLLPARRHARRAAGAGRGRGQARRDPPLRHPGDPGGDLCRPGPGRAHRHRRTDSGRRGRAQPGPAGRLPDALPGCPATATAGRLRYSPSCVVAPPRSPPALLADRPPQPPLRTGVASAPSTTSSVVAA